jgi:hypothetical protein
MQSAKKPASAPDEDLEEKTIRRRMLYFLSVIAVCALAWMAWMMFSQ